MPVHTHPAGLPHALDHSAPHATPPGLPATPGAAADRHWLLPPLPDRGRGTPSQFVHRHAGRDKSTAFHFVVFPRTSPVPQPQVVQQKINAPHSVCAENSISGKIESFQPHRRARTVGSSAVVTLESSSIRETAGGQLGRAYGVMPAVEPCPTIRTARSWCPTISLPV